MDNQVLVLTAAPTVRTGQQSPAKKEITSRTGRPPEGRISRGTHLGSRTKKPPTKGVWWSAQAVKVTAWSASAGVWAERACSAYNSPATRWKAAGTSRVAVWPLRTRTPTLNWWFCPWLSGRACAQLRRPGISSGPAARSGRVRPVRALVFPGHPDVAVVAVQPAGVGQAPGGAAALVAELLVIAAAGVCRAGWYSRRVRASAERGRVQGPGHPRPIRSGGAVTR